MNAAATLTARGDANGPLLERILNRLLRCSHRHQTSPLTLRGESFAVCLDCGAHVPYNLRALRGDVPLQIAGAGVNTSHPLREHVGAWTREAVCLGLLVIGLASGLLYSVSRRTPRVHVGARKPMRELQRAESARSSTKDVRELPAAVTRIAQDSPSPPRRPSELPRLEAEGRVVVLGRDPPAALVAWQHTGKLGELIENGSLFAVPRGTKVQVRQRKKRLLHVVIMDGSMAGQDGWVPAAQVAW